LLCLDGERRAEETRSQRTQELPPVHY
jgi:hypothetical protein